MRAKNSETLKERLLRNFTENERGCWIWQLFIHPKGYGLMKWDGRMQRVHRLAWLCFRGEIPADTPCVCHTCDNRACINPDHLFLGTNDDNVADKVRKGRQSKGEKQGIHSQGENHVNHKITEQDVLEIFHLKKEGFPQNEIAKKFNISDALISRILHRKAWQHLNVND